MRIITVPLSKLTRQILLRDYKSLEDIRLSSYDYLHDLIYCLPSSQVTPAFREKILTESATFQVSDKMAHELQVHANRVGKAFHQYHEAMLQNFLTLADINGDGTKHTVELIYKVFNIDESDYSYDNVTRRAHRVKNSRAFFAKKAQQVVRQNSQKITGVLTEDEVLSDSQLNRIINKYFAENEHFFYTQKKKFKGLLLVKLRVYVYYTIGQRSAETIATKFKIPLKTVYKKKESFQNDLLYLPAIL